MPDWVITGLQEQEESPGVLAYNQILAQKIIPGTTVQITLADNNSTEATVFSYDGGQNIVVLLDLLQQKIKTTLPLTQLKDIAGAEK